VLLFGSFIAGLAISCEIFMHKLASSGERLRGFVMRFSVFYKCMFLLIFMWRSKNVQALPGAMAGAFGDSAQNLSTQLSTDNVGNLAGLSGVRRAAAGCVG
jgi:hypothetical protein